MPAVKCGLCRRSDDFMLSRRWSGNRSVVNAPFVSGHVMRCGNAAGFAHGSCCSATHVWRQDGRSPRDYISLSI